MQILLINNNSSISKLIHLTAKKYDYDIEEIGDIADLEDKKRDIVIVDDEAAKEIDTQMLKEKCKCEKLIYIGNKNSQKPEDYSEILIKPFLPSDFKDMVDSVINIEKSIEEDVEDEIIAQEVMSAFDQNEDEAGEEELDMDMQDKQENKDDNQQNDKADEDVSEDSIEDEELLLDEDLFLDDEESLKKVDYDEDGVSEEEDKESVSSILDKDDIEEVKELLNESEDDETLDEEDEEDIQEPSIEPTEENFDISDLKDEIKDMNVSDQEVSEIEIGESKKEEDLSKDEVIEDNKTDDEQNHSQELDLIDEESLKELFGETTKKEEVEDNIIEKEEDMQIESFEDIKPKEKKKKKKKKKKSSKKIPIRLQEEITSKLLDIDTLREVLDGMEIRIKFYNKNKK